MYRFVITLTLACASLAQAQNLRIVNAASLSAGAVSPGTIITIFGTKLTTGVTYATDVQKPPVNLGGVTVSIGGTAAALFFVSPTQINAVVGAATPTGTQTVTVNSGSSTQTGNVTISTNTATGLFSLFGTGTRDGAILNAVTFLLGDFSTRTANSPTFLALFATGLNLSGTPTVTIGGVPVTVVFSGAAPCCLGLDQINVQLPDSLAGAGRVPVVVSQGGVASNTVQVVLLPPQGQAQLPGDEENKTRSREIAGIAWVPGTSLVLVADQNDDVVRVVDVKTKQVTHVIALPTGANPQAIAVMSSGALALVAESGTGKVAVINLTTFMVIKEIATGPGPVRVAIGTTLAAVVNGDNDTVSIIDLSTNTLLKTLSVGRAPEGVAIDAALGRAYVLNEDDGSISVIDLATQTVLNTIVLGASLRPESIALNGAGFAFITVPASGPDGQVIVYDITGGTQTTIKANPDRSGGSSDVVFFNGKLYFANQTGGSVSVLPFTGGKPGTISTIKVDLGVRALAIDAKDNLLVVSNEGSGTLVLVDLSTNAVVGRISAVRTDDNDSDDHRDRDKAANLPAVQSVTPASSKAGVTLTVTITGTNLTGATNVTFDIAKGKGGGDDGDEGNGNGNTKPDSAFTTTGITVNSGGTQLTATVKIAAGAQMGAHIVRVVTPNGESSGTSASGNTFTVTP
jgi:uncharacterized protein (TIGR03437 family)